MNAMTSKNLAEAPYTGMTPDWEFMARLDKNGHRIFRDKASGYIGIADNSGPRPDTSEDGTLWLVTNQVITISQDHKFGSSIELIREDDSQARWTSVGWDGALKLAELFEGITVVFKTRMGRVLTSSDFSGE